VVDHGAAFARLCRGGGVDGGGNIGGCGNGGEDGVRGDGGDEGGWW